MKNYNLLLLSLLICSFSLQADSSVALTKNQKSLLINAVKKGLLPRVKTIINKSNVNIPVSTATKWTVFIYAANHGQTKIMSYLYKIDPTCVDKTTYGGGTAFIEAVRSGSLEAMNWFKNNNILKKFINKKDDFNWSPLMRAVEENHYIAVQWLLKNGAFLDKNAKNSADLTIFDYAKNNKKMLKLLNTYVDESASVSVTAL